MKPLESLALARGTVDRVTHRRNDKEWLDAAWADPRTRVLVVSDGRALVRLDDDHAELVFVSPPEAPAGTRFLLGQDADGVVYFGVSADLPPAPAGARAALLREVGALWPTGTIRIRTARWTELPRCPTPAATRPGVPRTAASISRVPIPR